jgi:sulfatase maturation enzyme AslB (radical SAM superfamily)
MKSCFGDIYPDVERFQFGKPLAGKVFQISVNTLGPGHRDRKLDIDMEAWQECRQCEDFQNCFDFSSAKLQMQRVLREL